MIKKRLKILIVIPLLTAGLLYLFLYLWFHNSINRVLSIEQQNWLIEEIRHTPELPDKIYNTMEKYFPDFFYSNSWNHKIKRVLGINTSHCQCNEIYLPVVPGRPKNFKKKWIPFNQDDLVVKLFIEKNFTPKKCFTFNMNISEFGMNTTGITEAAKVYFNKELIDLTEEEIIGLYFIQKAPTKYSPIYNPKNYKKAVNEVMKSKN